MNNRRQLPGRWLWALLIFVCFVSFILSSCSPPAESEPVKEGDTAPDFCLKDINGNIIILSRFEGSPVIIRFMETDCKFCKADTPIFNRYFEKYKERGLQVVYISASTENKKEVVQFIDDLEIPFPVIMDEQASIADLYGVFLYPQTLVLNPERQVLAIIPGGVGEAELQELVGEYLN
jgi:peroxiredoxin